MDAKRVHLLLLQLLVLVISPAFAQNPLESRVTVNFQEESVEGVLSDLAQKGFRFSYNPDLLPANQSVSGSYSNQRLEDVLNSTLGDQYEFIVRGSYVIIQKQETSNEKQSYRISGELVDASTGRHLSNATIYEVNRLSAALSDDRGYYDLSIKKRSEYALFAVSKENYKDTIIQISVNDPAPQVIRLQPKPEQSSDEPESPADTRRLSSFFVDRKSRVHVKNVELVENRAVQLSLVPVLGTNHLLSGQVNNHVSLNMIAGYSHGIRGVELGGAVNIVRKEVKGFQAAGFGNIVGATATGVQLAGFMNSNLEKTRAVQMAGVYNLVAKEVSGVQGAGIVNLAEEMQGTQLAGFWNYTKHKTSGFQAAGFFNFSQPVTGAQAAGFMNYSWDTRGAQAAGFYNQAKDLNGLQIAGFMNKSRDLKGVQLSGFLNVARDVSGLQIGVVNFSRKIEKGAAIGLFNFVKEGFNKLEAEYNDVTPIHLSFRSGAPWYYTILTAGVRPGEENLLTLGLGMGTQMEWKEKNYANLEFIFRHLHSSAYRFDGLDDLLSAYIRYGYSFAPAFSINAGPVLHLYLTHKYNEASGTYGAPIGENPLWERTTGTGQARMWVGYQVALRFL